MKLEMPKEIMDLMNEVKAVSNMSNTQILRDYELFCESAGFSMSVESFKTFLLNLREFHKYM